MSDAEPTLLLTRPEPQSRGFLNQCEAAAGRRLPAVITPLMEIVPTGVVPELDRFETILFTSGNGIRCLRDVARLTKRSVCTVGERTAELARSLGADAVSIGEDVESFLANADQIAGPALLCRGEHSRGEVASRLAERGVEVEEAVIYDQVAQPLSTAGIRLLAGEGPVIAPIFSPRTAVLLGRHAVITAPLTVVAMSRNVAEAWAGPGTVQVAERPTSAAMCARTLAQF